MQSDNARRLMWRGGLSMRSVCCGVPLRFVLVLLIGGVSCSRLEAAAPELKGVEYFEKHIRPLLIKRCFKCHSKQAKIVGGNLLLDSKAGWVAGGDLGPAIVPGNVRNSLLIKAIRYSSDDVQMPPDGKLPA